jgi:imidazolonepropionase-like amidohydrolase
MHPDSGTPANSTPPVLVSCRWALYKAGGYGARFGISVSSPGSIKTEIVRLKNAGADIIKTMASGMVSLRHPGSVTPGGFDRKELHIIVQEAAFAGLGVMAHANGEEAILAAADAGVRSIEHGFFMTERALELMARNRIFWVPTTAALVRAADRAVLHEVRQFVSGQVREHLAMLRLAHSFGVPLAVGTDCTLPDPLYRDAYDSELAYFRETGISEEGILKIASEDGARLLGIEVDTISTDKGKQDENSDSHG